MKEINDRQMQAGSHCREILDEIFEETWRVAEINMSDQNDEVHLFGADEGGFCIIS
jgi:hypothetical protein